MFFKLYKTPAAEQQLIDLENDAGLYRQLKAVRKALGLLQQNPNHPSLNTKPWKGEKCSHNKTLFEAYAQNKTPGAYRIFFCYPPDEPKHIWIVAIVPHP